MWVSLVMFGMLCCTVLVCMKINANTLRKISDNDRAAHELEMMTEEQRADYYEKKTKPVSVLKPSPYGIARTMAKNGKWGWTLTKDGEKIAHNGTYEVWFELHHVRTLVHEMERNDGCQRTIF